MKRVASQQGACNASFGKSQKERQKRWKHATLRPSLVTTFRTKKALYFNNSKDGSSCCLTAHVVLLGPELN
eukprot:scaffold110371_cov16-Tisochrysis_lutea.AAC.1